MQFQNAVSKCSIECTQSNAHNHFQFLIESIAHMTLSKDYEVPVRAWLNTDDNMTEECSGQERQGIKNELTTIDRREKDNQFKHLDEDARFDKYRTEFQIERLLKNLLLANRNGIFKPEYTKHGLERGLVGEESSRQGERLKASNATLNADWNPINNPLNNPIAGARIKEANRVANVEFFRTKFPDQTESLVTPEQAEVHRQRILDTKFPQLGDLSIQDYLRTHPNAGLYVGMTGQVLENEDLRWLTIRGRPMKAGEVYVGRSSQKNRPSILKSDGNSITMKEARDKYGFRSFVVYESPIKTNVCSVEDALQNFLQHKFIDDGHTGLRLGRRFWRHVAMGPKTHTEAGHYKTFVTFSVNIGDYYGENGTVKVNH